MVMQVGIITIRMRNKVFQVLTKCQGHHCTGNEQVPPIKTSSSVVEVAKLMPWRQAKSPLKFPAWSGGCQLLENVWRRHFTTWSGGNLQRWSCLPPSHQFDYFHHRGWCFYGCQLVIAHMVVSLTFGQHLEHLIDQQTENLCTISHGQLDQAPGTRDQTDDRRKLLKFYS